MQRFQQRQLDLVLFRETHQTTMLARSSWNVSQNRNNRPALDKRAGRAEYRNDDGDSSAPVLCRWRGGGLKYEGRTKKEELGKRQSLWRRFEATHSMSG